MLYADVISFFVTRNVKKSEKLIKIANIDGENLQNSMVMFNFSVFDYWN